MERLANILSATKQPRKRTIEYLTSTLFKRKICRTSVRTTDRCLRYNSTCERRRTEALIHSHRLAEFRRKENPGGSLHNAEAVESGGCAGESGGNPCRR